MKKVRIGVIGIGGMGVSHCNSIKKLENAELAFVCDIDKKVAETRGKEFNVPFFTDYKDAIKSKTADAVTIAALHWLHSEIAVYALKNGLNVLSEKPMTVTVADADKMVNAAKKNKKLLAVIFQRRTEPWVIKLKELISKGAIGEITRTLCVDPWYRPQVYYDSGIWRATWKGEGGGVLINQAPHIIDIFTYLAGLPVKIEAKTRTRMHKIEVENEVSAFLEYKNGAWGYYYTTTCEPSFFRMEIAGEKGKIVVKNTEITLYKYDMPISKFTKTTKDMWASLGMKEEKVEYETNIPTGHNEIIRNFVQAILKKETLLVSGEEGLKSVEFINACILSGKTGKPAKIPVNRKKYDILMKRLVSQSKAKKRVKVQRLTDPQFLK